MTIDLEWLRGCATALVTPFGSDGGVDDKRFKILLERQIVNGVKILVPCGTTGESATMSVEEDEHVIGMTVDVARDLGAKVIAGTGSNDTRAAVAYTYKARELGADAALVVAPYYNKPTQEGLFAHFATIASSVRDFPLVIYNVPGRTSSNISADTCVRLATEFENIVGIKEASGNFSQIMQIIAERPANFKVFAGDDLLALPLIAVGADGLISVCANEVPKETSDLVGYALDEDWYEAKAIHYRLRPLMEANFLESSPAPCKFVMSELSLLDENLRLPLVPVANDTRTSLREVLVKILTVNAKRASGS